MKVMRQKHTMERWISCAVGCRVQVDGYTGSAVSPEQKVSFPSDSIRLSIQRNKEGTHMSVMWHCSGQIPYF